MKKTMISIAALAVLASVFAFAGIAYAQSTNPPSQNSAAGSGHRMMAGGRGLMGGGQGRMMAGNAANLDQDGPMHDEMIAVFAEKLGISVEDLNIRLANGETMFQIADSSGLTAEQFQALMSDARAQAIAKAVESGDLTQTQADWMNQRGGMMNGTGAGRNGQGNGAGRGMRGAGGSGVHADCPMYKQTNP